MDSSEPIEPLPGQGSLPGFEPQGPGGTTNPDLLGAWEKGLAAALAGQSLDDCPYPPRRRGIHRSYRRCWREGYESVGLFAGIRDDQRPESSR